MDAGKTSRVIDGGKGEGTFFWKNGRNLTYKLVYGGSGKSSTAEEKRKCDWQEKMKKETDYAPSVA